MEGDRGSSSSSSSAQSGRAGAGPPIDKGSGAYFYCERNLYGRLQRCPVAGKIIEVEQAHRDASDRKASEQTKGRKGDEPLNQLSLCGGVSDPGAGR